jgi:pSer/pThr/pTyr-binding forkhead associated (FHA) protein
MDWSLILFFLKWLFLGLVYLVLILLLMGVTREMQIRLPQVSAQSSAISIGRLRVLQPGSDPKVNQGTIFSLRPDTLLGAKRGSNILLRDHFISGKHARLRWDGVSWWVEDLNSTNGTYVNQRRIPPGAAEALPYGSILQIGDMVFEMIE